MNLFIVIDITMTVSAITLVSGLIVRDVRRWLREQSDL